MKRKLTALLVLLGCIFSLSGLIWADDPFTELLKKLEEFSKKHTYEKVHLHLDKPYYAVGDDIWFKAYVVDSKTGSPTTISNILYVELIDEKDSLVKLLKLPMQRGLANGDFQLTETLSEGNYRIRAYTQWMRNSSSVFFFDKRIRIGSLWVNKVLPTLNYVISGETAKASLLISNKEGKPYQNLPINYKIVAGNQVLQTGGASTNNEGLINFSTPLSKLQTGNAKVVATLLMTNGEKIQKIIPIKLKQNKLDVQFLPEGGNLTEGLPCKVAIKSINNLGLGENIQGTIVDNLGAEILSFETTYLGMGYFALNPEPGKTYLAKVKLANGSYQSIPLPAAQKSGYQLAVNNLDTAKIAVKVLITPDLLNKGELNLIGQSNGNLYFNVKVATNKQIATFSLAKSEFPSGVMQLTLFSGISPVSERMVFINNVNQQIKLDLSNLQPNYQKKGKVDFSISATTSGKPIQGSFSIAVTNANIITPDVDNESNILTGLLLSPELIGYIEKPNHYFLTQDLQSRTLLDNLMLTQGWRKINWKQVEDPNSIAMPFPAEKGMSISGTVTGKGSKPIQQGKIALLSSSKVKVVATTETDERGHFSFDDVIFGDSIRFVLQASTKDDKKDVKVKLDKVDGQIITENTNTGEIEVNVNASMDKYLKESNDYFEDQSRKGFLNRVNQLKTVNIVQKAKKEDSASVHSANLNGRGRANFIITAKDLENTQDLAQYLRSGRVPGVTVSSNPDFQNIPLLTRPRFPPANPDNADADDIPYMAMSLDGVIVTKFSADLINVNDIETIEVLSDAATTALYGSDGYYGVLVITYKRGSSRKLSDIYAPGLVTFVPKGYDTPRTFYSPKYEAKPDEKPDLRTTIFWNPEVVTDVSGKASINYFNASQQGEYRIVIEGIDDLGNLARSVFTYKVN